MAEQIQNPVVRFGVFEARLSSGELRKRGLPIRVPGQPFKILAMLLERPGEVVTRDELRSRLWSAETFVDFEHSLNSAIQKTETGAGGFSRKPALHRDFASPGVSLYRSCEFRRPGGCGCAGAATGSRAGRSACGLSAGPVKASGGCRRTFGPGRGNLVH